MPNSDERPWDRFTKELPTFYVSTKVRWREEDAFWTSAEPLVRELQDAIIPHLVRRRIAVSIGAGIGRLAVPVARQFNRLKVAEPSDVKRLRLQSAAAQHGIVNLEPMRLSDPWDREPADLVYSTLLFQHIEAMEDIAAIVRRIAGCLQGIAFLQFDTRRVTLGVRLRNAFPDALLPKRHRSGNRRIRRKSGDLRALFAACGLRIVDERNPDALLHVFILERAG